MELEGSEVLTGFGFIVQEKILSLIWDEINLKGVIFVCDISFTQCRFLSEIG